jgi:hypothetical protein
MFTHTHIQIQTHRYIHTYKYRHIDTYTHTYISYLESVSDIEEQSLELSIYTCMYTIHIYHILVYISYIYTYECTYHAHIYHIRVHISYIYIIPWIHIRYRRTTIRIVDIYVYIHKCFQLNTHLYM